MKFLNIANKMFNRAICASIGITIFYPFNIKLSAKAINRHCGVTDAEIKRCCTI